MASGRRKTLASRLRDRVTIRRMTDVSDGKGGFVRGWQDLPNGSVAAEVVSQNGREAVVASALQGVSAYRITIRRRTDLFSGDQLLFRPRGAADELELNIRSVADDPFLPDQATVIFADSETPQGAG
jgi:SPP1 family predicted phage head-tail adaptor